MEMEDLIKQSNLKVLFEGPSASGKTYKTCQIVVEVLDRGGEVMYCDTEAEGAETIVQIVKDGDYEDDVIEKLDYRRVDDYDELEGAFEDSGDYDLLVIDTLDHKHTYVLKAVTDAKRSGGADWSEYATIYSYEKEVMERIGKPETNVICTLDPESGSDDKPKGAQTNVEGYFSVVIDLSRGAEEWQHKIRNWIGESDWVNKKHPELVEDISSRIIERS